jgi:large subunit ribosomal protein L10
MDKAGKSEILAEIKEEFAGIQSVIVAHYAGVTVPKVTAMRDDFRKAGCHYRVIKNTLVKIAVKGSPMEPLAELMKGPTAIMWSTESAQEPAKIALKWAKDEPKFLIQGGFFDGKTLDAKGVDALSKMPGKNELRASLLMTFLAGPTDFVRTIIAGPQNFAYLLDARKRQLEGQS